MTNSVSDDDLYQSYLNGDHSAFRCLHDRYAQTVRLAAFRITRDRHAAEDVLQDTFAALHARKHSYKLGTNFRAWLLTLTNDHAALWMRKSSRSNLRTCYLPDSLVTDAVVGSSLEADELRSKIMLEVSSLLPSYARLIQLHFFDGFSYSRIAALLDIPVGTVKSRLHSAVVAFKKAWSNKRLV